MKNHFFFGYAGNKRKEVEIIFDEYIIKKFNSKLSQPNNIIVEPFCGSCSLSYYLSLKYPKHFKYILNDNDKQLIELLKIAKDNDKLKKLEDKINEIAKTLNKNKYLDLIKSDSLEGFLIKYKIYKIRAGMFPNDYSYKKINLINAPIINFLRTEDIEIYNFDALKIIEQYKENEKALIFLDPPYLQSSNNFYKSPVANIYEYIYNNDLTNYKSYIFLILESIWIIKLLFKNYNFIEYNKKYDNNQRETIHILITSK